MKQVFEEIPDEYKITSLVNQNTYLVGGELKEWKGANAEVFSTISSTEELQANLIRYCARFSRR